MEIRRCRRHPGPTAERTADLSERAHRALPHGRRCRRRTRHGLPRALPGAFCTHPALLGTLASEGILLGVKDSSGDLDNHRREAMALAEVGGVGYSGSETCIDMAVLAGFTGSIPGLANVYPRTELAVIEAAREGRWPEARRLQEG
ncbi:hypothetical protein G7085_12160 [Tessaracoccus sp. HDW20]|nr:hypothetical protein [Tessaracoccus coleopterorum]